MPKPNRRGVQMKRRTTTRLTVLVVAALGALLVAFSASALARDRNNDKIPDRWERTHGLSLNKKKCKREQEADQLRNRGEFRASMDPKDADTDDDGIVDGDENAGVVDSFDPATGLLTIDVFNGPDVTGLVTSDTEIECGNEDEDEQGEDDDPGEQNGNPGPGGDEEDHSGPGDDDDETEIGETADEDGDEDEDECTIDDLVEGAIVHEAEIKVTADGTVFVEIEIVKG